MLRGWEPLSPAGSDSDLHRSCRALPAANRVQRLLGQPALVGDIQVEEFAPSVDNAANSGNALSDTGLAADEIVGGQLALP